MNTSSHVRLHSPVSKGAVKLLTPNPTNPATQRAVAAYFDQLEAQLAVEEARCPEGSIAYVTTMKLKRMLAMQRDLSERLATMTFANAGALAREGFARQAEIAEVAREAAALMQEGGFDYDRGFYQMALDAMSQQPPTS